MKARDNGTKLDKRMTKKQFKNNNGNGPKKYLQKDKNKTRMKKYNKPKKIR